MVLLGVGWLTVAERQVLQGIQRRRGPNSIGWQGQLQFLQDGIKLVVKEMIEPLAQDKGIYRLGPIIQIMITFSVWMFIPLQGGEVIGDVKVGLVGILGVQQIGVYGVILGGYGQNQRYAYMGGIRQTNQMIQYEVSLGILVGQISILNGGILNMVELKEYQEQIWNISGQLPLGILIIVQGIAETNRHPFDLPEAEQELVSGYNVEYSSLGFVLYFIAEYGNIIMVSVFGSVLLLGGSIIGSLQIIYLIIFARGVLPRYRYDKLLDLGWKSYLPFGIGVLLLVVGISEI